MERIDKIIRHPSFIENLNRIDYYEKNRGFCKHDLAHLLDVARIGTIIWAQYRLTNNISIENIADEYIYAAALLHDIGRAVQYEMGIMHEEAGAKIAEIILRDCDFSDDEIRDIVDAILNHRNKSELENNDKYSMAKVLCMADKISRCCFACNAKQDCNWVDEDKNNTIIY